MNCFKNLDERQQKLYYKAGFETSYLLVFLLFIKMLLTISGFLNSNDIIVDILIIYIALDYNSIRKSLLGCDVDDKSRTRTRIIITILALCTLIWDFIVLGQIFFVKDTWIKSNGNIGIGLTQTIITLPLVINAIIYWVQKYKGWEEN